MIRKCYFLYYYLLFIVIVLTRCAPEVNRRGTLLDHKVREYLRAYYAESPMKSRVIRYGQFATWLFKPPVFGYMDLIFGFDFFVVVALRGDSIYLISEESGFNRLIEKEPYLVENDSSALELVKEFFRFSYSHPGYELVYLNSIKELPHSQLENLGSLETGLPKEILENDSLFLKIRDILKHDITPPTVKRKENCFEVHLYFYYESDFRFNLGEANYTVSPNGKLKGKSISIYQEF